MKTNALYKFLFQLLVFLIPSQLAYHLWPEWAHIFGIRVDYLAPTIYATDILVLLLLIFYIKQNKNQKLKIKNSNLIIVGLVVFGLLNIMVARSIYPAIFKSIKVGELVLFAYLVKSEKKLDIKTWILWPLSLSIILFSVVGITQFLFGHTIGGPFYWLGERSFNKTTPGISKVFFLENSYLRPYSTFPHPNSLAGFLAVSLFMILLLFNARSAFEKILKAVSISIGLLTFALIASLGAVGGIVAGGIYCWIYKEYRKIFPYATTLLFSGMVILSLLSPALYHFVLNLFKIPPESLLQRATLSRSAEIVISQNPIFGVGLNNFFVASGLLQPVHNIFLLVFSETGLLGLLLFLYLIFKTLKNLLDIGHWQLVICFVVVFMTGLADHYWLTLQQNQLLLALVFGLSFRAVSMNHEL